MKIDAHQHFWRYDSHRYSWIGDEMSEIQRDFQPHDLEPLLNANGFDACIAVQAEQTEEETVRLLEHANSQSFIKGVVGWIDLFAENVDNRLELYSRDPSFKGVRHTVWDKKGEFMTNSSFQKGIKALGKFNLTYDILAFDYQLEGAIELVKKFPDQAFVLDHMGKPQISGGATANWKKNIRELGSHSNVFCKLSGLVTETKDFRWEKSEFTPFLSFVTEIFGPYRLIFGSDWPVCLAAASYEEVVAIIKTYFQDFSQEEKAAIFGGNAIRFYNLQGTDDLTKHQL